VLRYKTGGDEKNNNAEDLKILGKYRMKGYSYKEINQNIMEVKEKGPVSEAAAASVAPSKEEEDADADAENDSKKDEEPSEHPKSEEQEIVPTAAVEEETPE